MSNQYLLTGLLADIVIAVALGTVVGWLVGAVVAIWTNRKGGES